MTIYLINRDCIGGIKQYNHELYLCASNLAYEVVPVNYVINEKIVFPTITKIGDVYHSVINRDNLFFLKRLKIFEFNDCDIVIGSEVLEFEFMRFLGFQGHLVYTLHGNSSHYFRTLVGLGSYLSGIIVVNEKQRFGIPEDLRGIPLTCLPQINTIPTITRVTQKPIELIFVGRVSRAKGIDLFIDLCYLVQGEKVIVASNDDLDESFMDKIDAIPDLTFVSNLDNDLVLDLISRSRFLINPSRSEGFGIVIIEAIKCYTVPIVLKGSGGPEEILQECPELVLDEIDFAFSALRIIQSLRDEKSADVLIESLRDSIKSRYSIESLSERFVDLVRHITIQIPKGGLLFSYNDGFQNHLKNVMKILWRKLV